MNGMAHSNFLDHVMPLWVLLLGSFDSSRHSWSHEDLPAVPLNSGGCQRPAFSHEELVVALLGQDDILTTLIDKRTYS